LLDPFGESFHRDRVWHELARLFVFFDADDEQTAVDSEGCDVVGELTIRALTAWQLSLEVELVMLGLPPSSNASSNSSAVFGRNVTVDHSPTVLVGPNVAQRP
jgi:hypothetical protein